MTYTADQVREVLLNAAMAEFRYYGSVEHTERVLRWLAENYAEMAEYARRYEGLLDEEWPR